MFFTLFCNRISAFGQDNCGGIALTPLPLLHSMIPVRPHSPTEK